MLSRKGPALLTLTIGAALVLTPGVPAQGKKSDSVVKAKATAERPDRAGKQVVTITLEIDPKFYLYANPVGNEDFEDNRTEVTITGKSKPESVKVEYPPGSTKKEKGLQYRIYKDRVTIKAVVTWGKAEPGPLGIAIKVQACDNNRCLLPATIKLTVP
jgi:hypothetical protein